MTDTGFYCPVEGCGKHADEWNDPDEHPFQSVKAVRQHIYAMSDDPHAEAEDAGAWTDVEARENPASDDENDDENDDEEPEDMVSPEEYEQQENGTDDVDDDASDDGTDDDVDSTTSSSSDSSGLVPSNLPSIPPMYAFAIVAAIFAAVVIWRVMQARSSNDYDETIDDDENEQQANAGGMSLIEE